MMKSIFIAVVAVAVAVLSFYQETAQAQGVDASSENKVTQEWRKMDDNCVNKLNGQIKTEFDASIVYLKLAAHFAHEKINLPGFEKYFFNAASEEREHGIKLIEYALMRGNFKLQDDFKLDYSYKVPSGLNGLDALHEALKKEEQVTKSIRDVIAACEKESNDYHLVDWLTGEYLEEQHKGMRDIAEKHSTLEKMMRSTPKLSEFLFDKTLL